MLLLQRAMRRMISDVANLPSRERFKGRDSSRKRGIVLDGAVDSEEKLCTYFSETPEDRLRAECGISAAENG